MCRTGFHVVLLLAVGAAVASAQDSTLAKMRRRADSLAREWRQATAFADLADSLERDRAITGGDTIAVGALRIITNPSPLPLRAAAARAWPVIDSLYGSAAQELARRPYIIRAVDPDTTVPRPRIHVGMELPWHMSENSLTLLLVSNVPIGPPDQALEAWLSGPVRPSVRAAQDRAGVYIQLVTSPSQAARNCLSGVQGGCRIALGLGDSTGLDAWYPGALERRALVTTAFTDYFDHGATAGTLRLCIAGSDSACTSLLRSLPPGALPKPLGSDARVTLAIVALQVGGRDAYRRLLADPAAPVGRRLASAARMSEDSLLAVWRAGIIASRPSAVVLPPFALVIGLAWISFFAACGLRSSRWRVG